MIGRVNNGEEAMTHRTWLNHDISVVTHGEREVVMTVIFKMETVLAFDYTLLDTLEFDYSFPWALGSVEGKTSFADSALCMTWFPSIPFSSFCLVPYDVDSSSVC